MMTMPSMKFRKQGSSGTDFVKFPGGAQSALGGQIFHPTAHWAPPAAMLTTAEDNIQNQRNLKCIILLNRLNTRCQHQDNESCVLYCL